MAKSSRVLIKFFLLLWMVCVVLCAHQKHHKKRDVHRIIIKPRSPRSHKNHHGHGHNSRKKGHKKGGKRGSDESNSSSFEDDSGSYSSENSFEDSFHGYKSHTKLAHKKPSYNRHRLPSNLDVQETRQHPFREDFQPFYNDWIPLSSDQLANNAPLEHHRDHHREKDRRNKRKSKKHSQKPPRVEFTTYSPVPFESSTFYPPIDVLSTFTALNQKIIDTNPPILSTLDKGNFNDSVDKLKNHKSVYDVTEGSSSGLGDFILVTDKSQLGGFDFGSAGNFDAKDFGSHGSKSKSNGKYKSRSNY